MITESNIDNLYRITSNLSNRDYQNTLNNYKQHHKCIKYGSFSYSLSGETLEALEHYKLATLKNITKEQEEQVKAYLLKIKFFQPNLLTETNGNYEQWHNTKILQAN